MEDVEVAYSRRVAWTDFQANASGLAAQLDENATASKPFDLGGACPEYEAQIRWLIGLYDDDPAARTTGTGSAARCFFDVEHPSGVHRMSVYAARYDRPPPGPSGSER